MSFSKAFQDRQTFPPPACIVLAHSQEELCFDGGGSLWVIRNHPLESIRGNRVEAVREGLPAGAEKLIRGLGTGGYGAEKREKQESRNKSLVGLSAIPGLGRLRPSLA